MVRDALIVWLDVEVTELPDNRVDVFLLVITFGFRKKFFPFEVVEFTTLLEFLHDLEEPVRHSFWELSHEFVSADIEFLASSEVFEMDLGEGRIFTSLLVLSGALADATLTVKFAQRWESLVVAATNVIRGVLNLWAFVDTFTDWSVLLVYDTFLTPTTDMIFTGVLSF